VLVRNELEYLLCETGPGNRPIDPEFLYFLTKERLFIFPGFDRIPEMITFLNQKGEIEKYIFKFKNFFEILYQPEPIGSSQCHGRSEARSLLASIYTLFCTASRESGG